MTHHDQLWSVCHHLPADYSPYGAALRDGPDCSAGCKFYYPLADRDGETISLDWGVCASPKSHRAGLATFEHQGCEYFLAENP